MPRRCIRAGESALNQEMSIEAPSSEIGLEQGQLDIAIREILAVHGRLHVEVGSLGDRDSLFSAGMNSFANINVMLALEERFGIEFPDSMLRRSTFESVSSIGAAVRELGGQVPLG
ncbi:MAG: acyl carrier protein [Acidimicrobiales bacterium]